MTPIPQAGVIPWRGNPSNPEILLITTRSTGQWITPKGMIESGMKKREVAMEEAWEEAGVRGEIFGNRMGIYTYQKRSNQFRVAVFSFLVQEFHDHYPEAGQRSRQWVTVSDAVRRVTNPELAKLIARLPRFLRGAAPLASQLAS